MELLEGKELPGVAAIDAAPSGRGRRNIVGGNWKSNPAGVATVKELAAGFSQAQYDTTRCEVVIFPTALHGAVLQEGLATSAFEVGVQNISKTGSGAFTGECFAEMVAECGYGWACVGHSERRSLFGESDEDTALKTEKALAAGLRVILCIGETLEEREKGVTDAVNQRQLSAVLPRIQDWSKVVIAYEPVWAIGTGKVATPDQAQETHVNIRKWLASKLGEDTAQSIRIQYGGSASPDNCGDLISKPDIDGFLVGGASLKPAFTKIIEACAK